MSDEPKTPEPPANTGANNVTKLADAAFKRTRQRKRPNSHGGDIYDRVDYGRDGPKASIYNLMLFLSEHEDWKGVFAYDEFADTIVKLRKPVYGGDAGELTDSDSIQVAEWFSNPKNLGANVRKNLAIEAIEGAAGKQKFHPVRDYLNGCVWDQEERLPTLLSHFCGAEQNDYTARIGVMVMVSAVARVFNPGCKVNFMLVLEGNQQIGKSTFVRELFGERWAAEAMESPTHKDFYQALRGLWGVEIAEMQSFSRAEVGKVKQAITQPVDHYRRSYDRYARGFPRQCVFVGTTNETDYLTDATGAARFLPVRVSGIETETLRSYRDQLWAEAVHRYRTGEQYWELPAQAFDEQEMRYRLDSWEEPVVRWLDGEADSDKYPADMAGPINSTTITDLMRLALGIEVGKHTRQDQMRVGAILRRLRWMRSRELRGGRQQYTYTRPAPQESGA